jgi:hypothetical protein
MKSKSLRGRLCVALLCALAMLAVTSSGTAAHGAAEATLPPNGVYTCAWIAAHPAAAAQAHVTCDPSGGPASASGALPAAGSVPTTPDTIDANGCQYVPGPTTRVGKGVWGWTTYEYASHWGWTANYGPADYTWYIQKTDGTNWVSGVVQDTGFHSINIASNVYRWGAQNHSSTAEQWYVCYQG